jgi:hypothetical protein
MSVVESEPYMEETYHLLYEGLVELLKNKAETFNPHYTDYLEAVTDKINYSLSIATAENAEKLQELRGVVVQSILDAFNRDYGAFVDEDTFNSFNSPVFARFIYYFFYFNKLSHLTEFMVSDTIANRKKLQERFKKDNKKDFAYARLKTELPDIKNPANIYVIMSYQEIAAERLSSGISMFTDLVHNTPLSFDQVEKLNGIFQYADETKLFDTYVAGLVDHPEYNHFLINFKHKLVEKLVGIN